MSALRVLYAPLFAYVLRFEEELQQNGSQPSFNQVRGALEALIEEQEVAAERLGVQPQYLEARFAFVAWADESVLKHTEWQDHHIWNAQQLQMKYYDMNIAGEQAFKNLTDLEPDEHEVREIYFMSLGLGFQGEYFRDEDAKRLRELRDEQAGLLHLPIKEIGDVKRLTPQPYDVEVPELRLPQKPPTPWLIILGIVVLVALPVLAFVSHKLTPVPPPMYALNMVIAGKGHVTSRPDGIRCDSQCEHRFASGTELMLDPMPEPGFEFVAWEGDDCRDGRIVLQADASCTARFQRVAALQEHLERLVAPYRENCAAASLAWQDRGSGVIALSGRLRNQAEQAELLQAIEALEGVQQAVADDIWLLPPHACEVAGLLQRFEHAEAQPIVAGLQRKSDGSYPVFQEKQLLTVPFQTLNFPSHVYIDYYTIGGQVGHLLPNTAEPDNAFDPKSSYTVGDPNRLAWEILPPFGLELVTVMMSRKPLSPNRAEVEDTSSYLSELRKNLSTVTADDVVTGIYFIVTREGS